MTYRSLACAVAAVLATACGGSNNNTAIDAGSNIGSDHDAGSASPDAAGSDDACTSIAVTRCTKLQTCSTADLTKRFGDLATCEAREQLTCSEALAAPATGQNAANILGCGSAIEAETCTEFFQKVPPAACTTVVGPGSGSAACGFAGECASSFCSDGPDALCGTCAPQPKVGDSCATTTCGQDLVCVAKTSLCQAPVPTGGACTAELPCADGNTCVGAVATMTTNTPGQCLADLETSGAACDAKHKTLADCDNDAGLTCDATTSQCVALPLVAAGQACGVINGVRTECTNAGTCQITAPATTGTCVAPAADGAACDTSVGPGCFTPAKCIPTTTGGTAGTCELPGSTTCS